MVISIVLSGKGKKMPRYIDADAVIDIAMQYCPDDDGSCSKAGVDIREMIDEIECLPTVDAEPVVRCKDCKKWETINCPFARDFVKWDGFKFCAWGERREDEE